MTYFKLDRDVDDLVRDAAEIPQMERAAAYTELTQRLIDSAEINESAKLLLLTQGMIALDKNTPSEAALSALTAAVSRFLADGTAPTLQRAAASAVTQLLSRTREPSTQIVEELHERLRKLKESRAFPFAHDLVGAILSSNTPLGKMSIGKNGAGFGRASSWSHLKFVRAAENCSSDAVGDWHKDPWAWPEMEWCARYSPTLVTSRIASGFVADAHRLDVAKDELNSRPAIVLDPLDRLAFQSLVDDISGLAYPNMPDWVFGWRLNRAHPQRGEYADNGREWHAFRSAIADGVSSFRFGLRVDIRAFFSSVDTQKLLSPESWPREKATTCSRLSSYVDGWNHQTGRSGLPQRFLASSILAQRYLQPVDEVIGDRLAKDKAGMVFRWMDDIWMFSDDEGALRSAMSDIENALAVLGLSLNTSKTLLFNTRDSLGMDFPDVSGPPVPDEKNDAADALSEQIRLALDQAEMLPRFRVGMLSTKIRRMKAFAVVKSLVGLKDSLPHCADYLARLFRDSSEWRELQDWYAQHVRMHATDSDWSGEAWSLMFPSSAGGEVDPSTIGVLRGVLSGRANSVLVPLACHRLRRWQPEESSELLRDVFGRSPTAFSRRALALASLEGIDREVLDNALLESEETYPTLVYLRAVGYRPPPEAPDFR